MPPDESLSSLEFHALLALAKGPSYGWAIQNDIEETLGGGATPTVGAIYRALARGIERGWVAEAPQPHEAPEKTPGRPRRYYTLTGPGRRVLEDEAQRLLAAVEVARLRDVIPRPG